MKLKNALNSNIYFCKKIRQIKEWSSNIFFILQKFRETKAQEAQCGKAQSFSHQKIFREINSLVTSLVKTLLKR